MFVTRWAAVVVAAALAACSEQRVPPAAEHAGTPSAPAGPGAIVGTVIVQGTLPAPEIVRLDADPKCLELAGGTPRRSEEVVVGPGGTLQHVFVHVKEGLPQRLYPVPREAAVLDQQQCRYVPRVVGVQVGQALAIRNSDPLLHNVRADSRLNQPFDIGTQPREALFTDPLHGGKPDRFS